jgi:hypothetical protein
MLGLTWVVILYFTARFFWMVLTVPARKEGDSEPASGPQPPKGGA